MTHDPAADLTGARLTRLRFDFRTGLVFSTGAELQLETPFAVTDPSGHRRVVDPEDSVTLAPVLALLGDVVRSASVGSTDLRLEFVSRTALDAWPDDQYESWHFLPR